MSAAVVEVFPKPSTLPNELGLRLNAMISLLDIARLNALMLNQELPRFRGIGYIHEIKDDAGQTMCIFKTYDDVQEVYAKKEAAVYLLDHPRDGRRSESTSINGFSGVPPAVFVRYPDVTGVLIEYVDTMTMAEYKRKHVHDYQNLMDKDQIHKVSLLDIRFGNIDRKSDNMLVQIEGDIPRVIPIDHEMSLANDMGYSLCKPHWMSMDAADETFSEDSLEYVRNLDASADLLLLEQCGWRPPDSFRERYQVLTKLLQRAVAMGFRANQIVNLASTLDLDVVTIEHDDDYVKKVCDVVEEKLLLEQI